MDKGILMKEQLTQSMKMMSLYTQPHADGKLSKVLLPTKHFCSFTGKKICSILHNN